jgi:hypothetical protein
MPIRMTESPTAFLKVSSNLAGIPRIKKQPIKAHTTIAIALTDGPNIVKRL